MSLTFSEIEFLVERLKSGDPIPEDYKHRLFPIKHVEYELAYAGKMRKEDVLANEDGVFPVPLQVEKKFNFCNEEVKWANMIIFGDNLQFLKTVYENKDPLIKDKVKDKVKLIYIDPPFGTGDEYDGIKGQKGYSAKRKGAEFVEFLRRRLFYAKEILSDDGWIFVRQGSHFGHYIKLCLDEIFGKNNFTNEIIVNRVKKNVTDKGRRNIPNAVDHIYVYFNTENAKYHNVLKALDKPKKGYWHGMDSPGIPGPRFLVIEGKTYYPPSGRHFTFPQDQADEKYRQGKLRVNTNTKKLEYWVEPKQEVNLDSNWTDIPGYTFTTDYPTENSEALLNRIISVSTEPDDLVLDFFAGSGTTASVAEKMGRRWIMCDIGKLAFYTMQKRLLTIEESKSWSNIGKKYLKKAKSFYTVNTGIYDLNLVFEMEKEHYINFVMNLFEVEKINKKISGIKIDGERKDGYYCLIYPHWDFKDAEVNIEYLEDLHSYLGSKVDGRLYIIAPSNYVNFITDYHEIDSVRYYFLKVPYQVIKELHKVHFKKIRQPQSKNKINDLEDVVGFHFIRQPYVKSELNYNQNKIHINIKEFLSDYTEEETNKDMGNFESLAMVLVDIDYDDGMFVMDNYYFASDLLPKVKKDEDEETIKQELKQQKEIIIELDREKCGRKVMVIYIDIYGNEFKEALTVGE